MTDEHSELLLAKISEATAEARAGTTEARSTRELVKGEMKGIQRQLNLLSGLPAKVAAHDVQINSLKEDIADVGGDVEQIQNDRSKALEDYGSRMTAVESALDDVKADRQWSFQRLTVAISVLALLVAVAAVIAPFLHH